MSLFQLLDQLDVAEDRGEDHDDAQANKGHAGPHGYTGGANGRVGIGRRDLPQETG